MVDLIIEVNSYSELNRQLPFDLTPFPPPFFTPKAFSYQKLFPPTTTLGSLVPPHMSEWGRQGNQQRSRGDRYWLPWQGDAKGVSRVLEEVRWRCSGMKNQSEWLVVY